MDFMKWLNSLDELLYEVMSWLIFFPLTLWRSIARPLRMMEYADFELRDAEDRQFEDTLSPPLFLLVALLISHGVALVLGEADNVIVQDNHGLASLVSDDSSLLILRLGIFSLFPLIYGAMLLRSKRVRITRPALKAPFYAQCYAAAPFALLLGIGTDLTTKGGALGQWGGGAITVAVIWYLVVQAAWFRHHLPAGFIRGAVYSILGFLLTSTAAIAFGWLIIGGTSHT